MQRRDKIKVQELIDFWESRANQMRRPKKKDAHTNLLAITMAGQLDGCANELKMLLLGKATQASGFKPKQKDAHGDHKK